MPPKPSPPADLRRGIRRLPTEWLVAGAVAVGLIVRRQVLAPTWEPRGADWGMWYASAAWFSHAVDWPRARWPLWGACASAFDHLVPGALHVDAMVFSMVVTGIAAAATYVVAREAVGWGAGLAAALLFVFHPMTLDMGGWLGAYSMWALCGPLAAAGLAVAVRTGRAGGWWVAGLAFGVCLAVQEKGLLTAAGLAPGILLALGLGGGLRERLRRALPGLLLPGALLAGTYAVFPATLSSLDAQVHLQVTGGGATLEGPAAPIQPFGFGDENDSPGWIFGRQMGPTTLLGVARLGLRERDETVAREQQMKRENVLNAAFPGADRRLGYAFVAVAALAVFGAARAARRRAPHALVAVATLLGVAATAIPALNSDFNLRFVLAPAWTVPALVAIGAGYVGTFARAVFPAARHLLPLLLAATLLGPLRVQSAWQWDSSPLYAPGEAAELLSAKVWYELGRRWPDATVDVFRPFDGGALAIDGRDGAYLSGPEYDTVPPTPEHYVIVTGPSGAVLDQEAEVLGLRSAHGGPADMGGRRIADRWTVDDTHSLYLLTPAR